MRSYQINIQQKVKVNQSVITGIRTAVTETLRFEQVRAKSSVTILLTDDIQLQELNNAYRGIDKPTDVLSFPVGDVMPGMEDDLQLGDIAISVPYAERQAYEGKHSVKSELQLLAVHGTLHLLGYDHMEPEEKLKMWGVQASILAQVGAEITGPPIESEDSDLSSSTHATETDHDEPKE